MNRNLGRRVTGAEASAVSPRSMIAKLLSVPPTPTTARARDRPWPIPILRRHPALFMPFLTPGQWKLARSTSTAYPFSERNTKCQFSSDAHAPLDWPACHAPKDPA